MELTKAKPEKIPKKSKLSNTNTCTYLL